MLVCAILLVQLMVHPYWHHCSQLAHVFPTCLLVRDDSEDHIVYLHLWVCRKKTLLELMVAGLHH